MIALVSSTRLVQLTYAPSPQPTSFSGVTFEDAQGVRTTIAIPVWLVATVHAGGAKPTLVCPLCERDGAHPYKLELGDSSSRECDSFLRAHGTHHAAPVRAPAPARIPIARTSR